MKQTIGRLIKQASNELSRQMNEFARQYNLTGTQMSVIDFLSNFPGNSCDQHQIEMEFAIKRSTTTVMLQRMAKKGLVIRQTSPTDRRQKRVKLTVDGEKLIPVVSAYINKSEEQIMADLNEHDIAALKQLLCSIAREEKIDE